MAKVGGAGARDLGTGAGAPGTTAAGAGGGRAGGAGMGRVKRGPRCLL